MKPLFAELRRRGVLGALVAYGVAAAGALQLADIVVHALDLPAWSLRALIALAAVGLPVTGFVSWFYDLTRRGFVRTQAPGPSPATPRAPTPATAPAALQAELKPGAILAGRYAIEGELGRGGMGRVLAARDSRLGRRVAVKVVSGAHDPARIQRFEQEARTAGSLEHPNVLGVYDLGEHEGVPFLVTELLEGHTLRTLLRDGPLGAARSLELSAQLARGLAAAHGRGIVHRDLKPENLFVTGDGRLKVLDFGLARLVADEGQTPGLTQTGAIFGTPGYLSPEQARGEKAGPASDVFSAGAILYEMLSGRRAFPGATLIEAGHATLNAEPQPLPITVPPTLEGIVMRCLQKDASRRFRDGADLARALEALAAGAAIPLERPGKSWRRSTVAMVALAALALGAALASALRAGRTARDVEAERTSRNAEAEPFAREALAERGAGAGAHPELPRIQDIPALPIPPVPPAIAGEPKEERSAREEVDREPSQLRKRAPRWGRMGLLAGVRALERANQLPRAEELLRRQRDPIARLELFLLQRRTGHAAQGRTELLDYLHKHPGRDWPTPLLQAYTGTAASDADALKAARDSGDPDEECEANYYLGVLRGSKALLSEAAGEDCSYADLAREALGQSR